MKTTATIKKMSKTVIECELRGAWADVECALRHGSEPSRSLGDYVAMLTRELGTRG